MNNSRNSSLLKAVLVALFLAAVLSAFSQLTGFGKNGTEALPAHTVDVSPQPLTEPGDIPVHPNAQSITPEPIDERSPSRKLITYHVVTSAGELIAFYDRTLIEEGWVSIRNEDFGAEFLRSYVWKDPQGGMPYTLALAVEITSIDGGVQLVSVWRERVPEITNIPLYPGAGQVNTRDEVINVERGFVQRTTSYVVSAQAGEVEEFYRKNMAQYGWWLSDEPNNDRERPGLFFYHFSGNPENFVGGSFAVAVTSISEDETAVDIRARGPTLDAPHREDLNK